MNKRHLTKCYDYPYTLEWIQDTCLTHITWPWHLAWIGMCPSSLVHVTWSFLKSLVLSRLLSNLSHWEAGQVEKYTDWWSSEWWLIYILHLHCTSSPYVLQKHLQAIIMVDYMLTSLKYKSAQTCMDECVTIPVLSFAAAPLVPQSIKRQAEAVLLLKYLSTLSGVALHENKP